MLSGNKFAQIAMPEAIAANVRSIGTARSAGPKTLADEPLRTCVMVALVHFARSTRSNCSTRLATTCSLRGTAKCLSWGLVLVWPATTQPVDRRFTKGPGPLTWLECAAGLPGRSVHVALALWHEAERSGSRCVALSNTLCLRFHVERNAKYRALRALELAGLVVVERRRGRSPRVTLLTSEGTT